jgi:GGDEF domain-containing protein
MRGAQAARSLSEVLWETLQDALAEHRTARVAELSARLAEVSLTVASLADGGRRPAPEGPRTGPAARGVEPTRARGSLSEPVVGAPSASAQPTSVPRPADQTAGGEQRASHSLATAQTPTAEGSAPAHEPNPALEPAPTRPGSCESVPTVTAVLVDELAGEDPLESSDGSRVAPDQQPDIEIRDERLPMLDEQDALVEQEQAERGHGESVEPVPTECSADRPVEQEQAERGYGESVEPVPTVRSADEPLEQEHAQHRYAEPAVAEHDAAPWTTSIERRLERYQQDGQAFALLLLELADVERLRHAELPGEVARLTTLVETELSAHLRPADSLMRETPGRYWLLAPQTDGSAAQALAAQMTAAVGHAASHRGAPLRLAVGIAVCPRDALDAAELVDGAEVALFEAHASGRALPPGADPSLLYDTLD